MQFDLKNIIFKPYKHYVFKNSYINNCLYSYYLYFYTYKLNAKLKNMKRINYWVAAGISQRKTLEEVYELILIDLNTTAYELGYGSRKREFIDRRSVICYLMHRIIGFSSTEVGRLLKCDHCTVLHHCNKLNGFLTAKEPAFKHVIELEKKYSLFKIKRI